MDEMEDAVKKIEDSVLQIKTADANKKTELLQRLAVLKTELSKLSQTHEEDSRSIAGFARVATGEAARREKAPHLLKNALQGLALTVKGFEASHPKLTETINDICAMLAQMGV
ncbi:MAG: DUF4404 family protein [Elusimicrobia bacterium]|nr:DUF4404 family protein [Elusimicrobiota bacterium]MDE2312887.1 DUF4404 family protein [Elusimicrobiota bacterium]